MSLTIVRVDEKDRVIIPKYYKGCGRDKGWSQAACETKGGRLYRTDSAG